MMLLLYIREINLHVCSRRNNVESGIKNINSMNHMIKTRKGESSVALILSHSILASSNVLVIIKSA